MTNLREHLLAKYDDMQRELDESTYRLDTVETQLLALPDKGTAHHPDPEPEDPPRTRERTTPS